MSDNNSTKIRKLFPDRSEYWGDGGGAAISYPVWIADTLIAQDEDDLRLEETRLRLVDRFRGLAQSQQDIQPNGIVHDIVDPSLHSRILDPEEHAAVLEKQDFRSDFREEGEDPAEYMADSAKAEFHAKERAHEETLQRRGAFQWVPTVVRCCVSTIDDDDKREARIVGNVAGLPERMAFTESLYRDLEGVLSAMLPLWAHVDLRGEGRKLSSGWFRNGGAEAGLTPVGAPHDALNNGELQVVIKIQEYVLPPHSTYTGRWHTEGFSENISAAGVYYLDVSNETVGGDLSFRPPNSPDEGYYDCLSDNEEDDTSDEEDENWDPDGDDRESDLAEDDAEMTDWEAESATANKEIEDVEVPEGYQPEPREERAEYIGWDEKPEDRGPPFFRKYVKDVPVQTGTAVVFHNTIPHRFRSIRNATDVPQRRLFINFFIVDPGKPLDATTCNSGSPQFIRRVLGRVGLKETNLQAIVLAYCGGYATSDFLHRKILRDQARAAMSKDRPHWYTLMFGNSGDLIFHGDYRTRTSESFGIGNYENSNCPTSGLGSGM